MDTKDTLVRVGQRVKKVLDGWPREVSARAKRLKLGREVLDSRPMAPPIGYKKQPSLAEQMREMIRGEALRRAALEQGFETFEESDDFDIPDDPVDPSTPYELEFEGVPRVDMDPDPLGRALEANSVKGSGGEADAPLDQPRPKAQSNQAGAGGAGDGIGEHPVLPEDVPGETLISGWFRPRPAAPVARPPGGEPRNRK